MPVLGNYIKIKHGFAFKGDDISTEDNNIVLVTPGNFSISGGFKEQKCKFFTGDYPDEYILKEDDLIVTMTDLSKAVDTLGYGALIPYSDKRTYLHNQRIGLVQFLNDDIDKHYLHWFMRSAKYQMIIAATSTGSTVHHTSPTRICEVEIDLPPVDIQHRIAKILDEIEEKINVNEKINRNLADQGRALYEDLISKYEINAKLSDLISSIETGSRPKGGAQESGVPSIGAEKIESFGVYDYSGEKYISEEFFEKLKRGHILSGDVLLYKDGAYTGKTSMALNDFPHAKCAINEHVYKLNSNNNLYQFFLYFTLDNKKNRDYIYTLASSKAAQPGLNQTELLSVDIAMPVETSLIEFEKNVSEMMNMIASNAKENRKLTLLRDSLLPKLMSGEIDVSELDV